MTIERWDDDKLDRFASIVQQAVISSDERMTRIEEGLGRIEQTVESNNRFLESFSQELRNYTNSMNNLAARIDGTTATNKQDRLDVNSRLAIALICHSGQGKNEPKLDKSCHVWLSFFIS